MLDVRKPIGWLFTLYGVILVVWGFVHPVITIIEGHNLSFNLNILWGAVLGVFGVFMQALAFFEGKRNG